MPLGHLSLLPKALLRRVVSLTAVWAKALGPSVRNEVSRRVSSCRLVSVESGSCCFSGVRNGCPLTYGGAHSAVLFYRERCRNRSVLLQCGSRLPSTFSTDKYFDCIARRWMYSYATGGDWQRTVAQSSSWDAILSLERLMRVRLGAEEYAEVLQACERRLVKLYKEGALLAKDLPSVLREHRFEQPAVYFAVGCASRLAAENYSGFSLQDMAALLYAVRVTPGRAKGGCERLQSIVNRFEKNLERLPSQTLMKALKDAAYLLRSTSLSLGRLMIGTDKRYRERLHEVTSDELLALAVAGSHIAKREKDYDFTTLFGYILEEYSSRLSKMPRHLCIQVLVNLTSGFPGNSECLKRMSHVLPLVDRHVAQSVSHIIPRDFAQLALCFARYEYSAEEVSFRDVFLNQMWSLSPHELTNVFQYISAYGTVDQAVLRELQGFIRARTQICSASDIATLLASLAATVVCGIPGCGECAVDLREDVIRRLSENPKSFLASQCAGLLYSLDRLNIQTPEVADMLFTNAVADFERLSVREKSLFVFGVLKFAKNAKYVADIQEAVRRTTIQGELHLGWQAVSITEVLVGLRLAHQPWLEEVICFSKGRLPALLTANLKGMIILLHGLSFLHFPCSELFEEVNTWLEDEAARVSGLGWCGEIVQLLWACFVQDVYPVKTLVRLRQCKGHEIEWMRHEEMVCLFQIAVIARQQHQVELLNREALSTLHKRFQQNQQCLPADVMDSVNTIGKLFPYGHVRKDVITADGLRIPCTLLSSRDASTVAWPQSVNQQPSVRELAMLRRIGYQPLAVMVIGASWLDLSGKMLGPVVMARKAMQQCGWDVLFIWLSEYCKATDKENFLQAELQRAGVTALRPPQWRKPNSWQ